MRHLLLTCCSLLLHCLGLAREPMLPLLLRACALLAVFRWQLFDERWMGWRLAESHTAPVCQAIECGWRGPSEAFVQCEVVSQSGERRLLRYGEARRGGGGVVEAEVEPPQR